MDSGLACLGVVARIHGKAANPGQLLHELGISGPCRAEDVLRAARRLGFKASMGSVDLARAADGSVPLPCIAELKDEGFLVLASVREDDGG